jgi:hypothetical protein
LSVSSLVRAGQVGRFCPLPELARGSVVNSGCLLFRPADWGE